jgi:hypothetical protein
MEVVVGPKGGGGRTLDRGTGAELGSVGKICPPLPLITHKNGSFYFFCSIIFFFPIHANAIGYHRHELRPESTVAAPGHGR